VEIWETSREETVKKVNGEDLPMTDEVEVEKYFWLSSHYRLFLTFPRHVLKRLTNFLNPAFLCPFSWGGTLRQGTRKSRWSQVGTSKIILDFYPVICLVR
jgi:hypothetical protein